MSPCFVTPGCPRSCVVLGSGMCLHIRPSCQHCPSAGSKGLVGSVSLQLTQLGYQTSTMQWAQPGRRGETGGVQGHGECLPPRTELAWEPQHCGGMDLLCSGA